MVRYSFQDLSFGKDSYRDGVIGKNNAPHVLLRRHLQYFIIVLEADADVSRVVLFSALMSAGEFVGPVTERNPRSRLC